MNSTPPNETRTLASQAISGVGVADPGDRLDCAVSEGGQSLASKENESFFDSDQPMIVCLEGRRFVVVHPGVPTALCGVDGQSVDVHQLRSGDPVVYRDTPTVVLAVDVYA